MKLLPAWILLVCVAGFESAGASTSEGTEFAIALPPIESEQDHYDAEIIINARETTQVTITTSNSSAVLTVYGNWSLASWLDYEMRTVDGIETKGILVTSVLPVTIHVATRGISYIYQPPDAFIARPVSSSCVEYFLTGYGEMYPHYRPTSLYMIVATEDNTEVDVHYADDVTLEDEHVTLNQYEVFTRDIYYLNGSLEIDLTGTRVLATKPVGMYSGHGNAYLYAPGAGSLSRYLFESLPTLDDLGTEYTSFPIHFGGVGGYQVRVIAVEDATDVSIPAFSAAFSLDMGEFYVVDNTVTRFGFKLSCSKPCMVVQYVRNLPQGGDTNTFMSAFLAVLTADDRAANNLIFTVPTMIDYSSNMRAAISIIVNTFPVTGLHLNDTSLADLDWQPVEDSINWYATVEIGKGFYTLHSSEPSERFTAYLYVNYSYSLYPAVCFPVGYGGQFDW